MKEKLYKKVNGVKIELTKNEYDEYYKNLENNNDFRNGMIGELKAQIMNEIYSEYPLFKQIDIASRIGSYGDDDFNKMKLFIENKMEEYRRKKEEIMQLE